MLNPIIAVCALNASLAGAPVDGSWTHFPTTVNASTTLQAIQAEVDDTETKSENLAQSNEERSETEDGENLGIDQIQIAPASQDDASINSFQIDAVGSDGNNKAEVAQLPSDLEVPEDNNSQPELSISQPIISPEAALYEQVADAWQVIRQRGQQPTPELVAREIGPDALARFLDQNPAASDIFGQDTDDLPVDQPGSDQVPSNGIFVLPPDGS